ncbi:MAG: beta-propeller domain-containing protein [Patescibacteria group bacterium]|nr:beta-propeller domain-containing protein [Patescibacteria group bacterium]
MKNNINQNLKNNGDYIYNNNGSRKNLGNVFLLFVFFVIFIAGSVILINSMKDGGFGSLNPFKPPVINEEEKEDLGNYIKKFSDYSEMQNFMDEKSSNVYGLNYVYGSSSDFIGGVNTFEERSDFVETKSSDAIDGWGYEKPPANVPTEIENPISSGNYSKTNVQIGGVDEGDIVKTDGKYIFTVTGSNVVIIDAYPAENSKEVSRIKLDSNPNGIYINNNKLIIYGQNYSYNNEKYNDIIPKNRFNNYSYIKIYDITDKANPIENKSYDFEGNLSDSRMIGDYVYFVTSSDSYIYDTEHPVPIVFENGNLLSNKDSDTRCNCPDVYYFDMNYYSYNFTSVNSINVNNLAENLNTEIYMLDGYQNNLFVSPNNLYITFNKRISGEKIHADITMEILKERIYPQLSAKDRERVEKIENADSDILSPVEKYKKIILLMIKYENLFTDQEENFEQEMKKRAKERYKDISKELEKTVIHKIAINKGDLKYMASGEVIGSVLNQFSMDENNNYFRIATTKNRSWSSFIDDEERESYSNLYVLDENMKVVGKVEELAKGERIYSVRFMQDRAYLVTFKQTDPLFVIDLADQTNPKVMGELKVPGFSSYLHPYDNQTLIGLGREADEDGRVTGGVKLSLFDVSDIANPKEIDKYVMGDRNSNSIAISEHKAFLFSKDKNLLVIPVSMKENSVIIQEGITFEEDLRIMPPQNNKYFNGVAVFNINEKVFELKGTIDHPDDNSSNWYGYNNVSRSLYIDDVLYSLSNKYMKANWLDTLNEAKTIILNETSIDNRYPQSEVLE